MTLKALLFDMDGTLVDSDPVHIAVFIDIMAERGIPLTKADYMERVHGRTNAEIFSDLLPGEDPHALDLAKEEEYRRRIGGTFEPIAGARELIARARGAGLKIGAVTNGPRANLDAILRATGLNDAFDCSVSSNDVTKGKPDPEPYLTAIRQLGVHASEALVFEDSHSGIRSARAAGIDVVGMASSLDEAALLGAGAILAIHDFNDPALERHLIAREGALA